MARLTPRRPLDGQEAVVAGVRLIARGDLTAHLLTTREPAEVDGAIRLGPCERLFVGTAPPAETGTALLQDMTAAFVFIDIIGEDAPARLGLQNDGATRLADLRVIVERHDAGIRVVADRSHADYLWSWLAGRLALA